MPTLTLQDNRPDGQGLHRLTFDRPLDGHDHAGQFLTAHVAEHKPAFFAIASAPGQPIVLLVKNQGDAAEVLCGMSPGAEVEVSDPMGNGFGLPEGSQRPLLILATGSGISAVRPVIQLEVAAGLSRPVTLLYGVFTPAHRSFVEDLEAWQAAGVTVHTVCDQAGDDWAGPRGFVQDAAGTLGLISDGVDLVLCGFPAMAEAAKARFIEAGLPEDRVHLNY